MSEPEKRERRGRPETKIAVDSVFGKLRVIGPARRNGRYIELQCVCECGKIKYVKKHNLLNGNTKSCGCNRRKNHLGERFDHWEIIGPPEDAASNKWLCRCDCGTVRYVNYNNLRAGISRGCKVHSGEDNHRFLDLSGQIHDNWAVLNDWRLTKSGSREWLCRCDCGTERYILATLIKQDKMPKCACQKGDTHGKAK